jgi:hypothetical protein
VGHVSRSSGLLRMEASQARVSQFASKLVEARWQVVHMAPSWRSRGVQVEDGWVHVRGYIRACYPYFAILYVLGPTGSLIF